MRLRTILLAAALPALLGSAVIVRLARAGPGPLRVQAAMTLAAGAMALVVGRTPPPPVAALGLLPVALALPLVTATAPGPHRWVWVGPVGLYVAAALLPAGVVWLGWTLASARGARTAWWAVAVTLGTAVVLAVQPDAPQVTAFAAAIGVAGAVAGMRAATAAATLAGLAPAVAWAWRQPDPLQPVPHVEGTLQVAFAAGPVAGVLALLAVAAIPGVLAWLGRHPRRRALLGVAAYYVVIDVLAAWQWTPMPLLGFGAGPLVGYALVAALAARLDAASPRRPFTGPSRTGSRA
jgi:hypothetical protein